MNAINNTEDYPFQSWDAYYSALTLSLLTEYYGEKYPRYDEFMCETGDGDYHIIKQLLEQGLDIQEGFDGLCKAIIEGDHYAYDARFVFQKIFNELFHSSVLVVKPEIFDAIFGGGDMEVEDMEDILMNKWSRAFLLKELEKRGDTIPWPQEWNTIEPKNIDDLEMMDMCCDTSSEKVRLYYSVLKFLYQRD
jgi:hypothetical protein